MSKPIAPSDAADKFMLRLPDGMRDRLKAQAEANKRSMNAEIVARLESTLGRVAPEGASHATQDLIALSNALTEAVTMAADNGRRVEIRLHFKDDDASKLTEAINKHKDKLNKDK